MIFLYDNYSAFPFKQTSLNNLRPDFSMSTKLRYPLCGMETEYSSGIRYRHSTIKKI